MPENKREGYTIKSAEAEELRTRLKDLLRRENKHTAINGIAEFAHALREKYSAEELHDYEAYCVLSGSTPIKQPEHFDLEGDEPIVRFIEGLEGVEEPKEK